MRDWKDFRMTEETAIRSGDFLKDIDISVHFRSGDTDIVTLRRLLSAVEASIRSICDTDVVVSEHEETIKICSGRKLRTLSRNFYIQ